MVPELRPSGLCRGFLHSTLIFVSRQLLERIRGQASVCLYAAKWL